MIAKRGDKIPSGASRSAEARAFYILRAAPFRASLEPVPLERIVFFLIYFGAGLAFLFGLGQFVRPGLNRRRMMLAFFFTSLGIIQLHAGLFHSGDILFLPHAFLINVPAIYFCGPLMSSYLNAVYPDDSGLRARRLWHFAPGIAVTIALIGVYAQPAVEKIEMIQTATRGIYPLWMRFVFTVGLGLTFLYALRGAGWMLRLLRDTDRETHDHRRPLTLLFIFFVACGALSNAAYVLASVPLLKLAYASVTLVLMGMYFLGLRYPTLFLHTVEGLRRQRSGLFRLKRLDLASIDRRLRVCMEEDRVYRDESLNLDHLATLLQISPEQLSQYLNKQLGKNFHAFVNEFRIREARELLRAEPKRTVLSVAYAVGFNSSSVFHDAFRKFTGDTPAQFRRAKRAKSKTKSRSK